LVRHFKELKGYREAFVAAMRILELSKKWPVEERYSLTDQIRRSSRSVCASIAEAWRKRRYPNHFVSKLPDADSEAAETQNWIEFAHTCGYLAPDDHKELLEVYDRTSGGLVRMMSNAIDWCGPSTTTLREPSAGYNETTFVGEGIDADLDDVVDR
jgi:four helix bundle protein